MRSETVGVGREGRVFWDFGQSQGGHCELVCANEYSAAIADASQHGVDTLQCTRREFPGDTVKRAQRGSERIVHSRPAPFFLLT